MRSSLYIGTFAVLLAIASPCFAQQQPAPGGGQAAQPGAGPVKVAKTKGNLKEVIKMIRDEAIASLKDKDEWPRRANNFSDDKAITLDPEDVMKALSQPVDRRPALDAYIRWQLLGFIEDNSVLLDRKVIKVFENLPTFITCPEPSISLSYNKAYNSLATLVSSEATQHQSVVVKRFFYATTQNISRIKRVPVRYVPTVKAVREEFNTVKQIMVVVNQPNIKYREDLSRRLPLNHPVRISFLMYDVKSRGEAREYSYRQVMDDLMVVLADNRDNRKISGSTRKALIKQIRRMNLTSQKPVILDIDVSDEGVITLTRYYNSVPSSYIQAGVNYLSGRDPAVVMKTWTEIDEDLEDEEDD